MLNLLKESSKKSPYRSRFPAPQLGAEFNLKGMRLPAGMQYCLILERRFWIVLGIVGLLYFFAIETGNDWMYLIASGGVTAIVLGILLPLSQIMDVETSCSIPPDAVAGDRLKVRVRLSRKSGRSKFAKFFPVKWVVVRAMMVGHMQEHSVLRPITVDTIVNEAWVVAQSPPLVRGVYELEKLETYSCFPFGLAWWSRSFDIKSKTAVDNPLVTVYARTSGVEGNFLWRLRASGSTALIFSATRSTTAMPSSSVRSLREFVTGDSYRLIHWPSSAKTGKLLVREFESEGLPAYDVMIDLTANWKNEEQFEIAVSLANSLLNLGFKMGGAPELYVIPDPVAPQNQLPECLMDLPMSPPGIARWAQLLARVEAVTAKDPNFEDPIPDLGGDSKLALLAVRPADFDDDNGAGEHRKGYNGIELWVLSRAFKEASSSHEKAESWAMGGKGIIPVAAGMSDRRGVAGAKAGPLGRILSTLEKFEDISRQ